MALDVVWISPVIVHDRLTAINDVSDSETQSIQRRPNYFNKHT